MDTGNADRTLDFKLIPEYDGSPKQSVTEWLEKLELVCRLQGISDVVSVIPLRLTGGAFAVYMELPDEVKKSAEKVKRALLTAFALDPFEAYEQFISRKWNPGEQPDVFLSDLRRLATLFGGVPEKALACAFVAGLPESVRQLLRAGSLMDGLSLADIVARARAVMTGERSADNVDICLGVTGTGAEFRTGTSGRRCYACGGLNHFARDCFARRKEFIGNQEGAQHRQRRRNRSKREAGGRHLSPQGNGEREEESSALPVTQLKVDGVKRHVLTDTGCSKCIVHVSCCKKWRRKEIVLTAANGGKLRCKGVSTVCLQPVTGRAAKVEAVVVDSKPLGFDFVLGMDGILALGGVSVDEQSRVKFGVESEVACAVDPNAEIKLEERDFTVMFSPLSRTWTMRWKWLGGAEPVVLKNKVKEYPPADEVRAPYEEELGEWIANGWLVPYDENKHGPARGLIPLMAAVQRNKKKVRPVMDFRELNSHIEAFTADSDVCAQRLREWRRQGVNVTVLDLKKAYLQIHVDKSLWPYQTVEHKGRRYCLTRLGFGLNVAPLVMKAVLSHALSQDPDIRRGTSAYIDDILVNEDVVKASRVVRHLARFGLTCKAPVSVADGTRVLGLKVWGEHGKLVWRRDSEVGEVPKRVTRRSVFSFCGRLVGHFPVCGWLRTAAAFLKRRANNVSVNWDATIKDAGLESILREIAAKVKAQDPVQGRWDVSGEKARIWVDASSLALGVAVEVGGYVIEDAAWLRPDDACHINMAELDAVIKGLNLALSWEMRKIELMTDSSAVYRWVSDALSGKARLRTKAASEMLIRRRVGTLLELVKEYGLEVTVTLVNSASNKADVLTRVPQRWLEYATADTTNNHEPVCAAVDDHDLGSMIRRIHHEAGHPGVRRTLYFVKRLNPMVSKRNVREVVASCETCQSIDPAPARWERGGLGMTEVWQRLAMDITHYRGRPHLTLIDCGPSRYAIWRPLRLQSSADVIQQLETIFCERGAPVELLIDNDTAFRSNEFARFAARWNTRLRFRCAYAPSGNGIVERCHRTVKVIAARKNCSISEAVYWYNIMPRDDRSESAAPVSGVYKYRVRVRGMEWGAETATGTDNQYVIGDAVWVRPPKARCDTRYDKGTVTSVVSSQAIEVDGMPRHVRDIRHRIPSRDAAATSTEAGGSEQEFVIRVPARDQAEEDAGSSAEDQLEAPAETSLRRSARERRPRRCGLCDLEIRGECNRQAEPAVQALPRSDK